jgi:hypothetical protein
VSICEGCVRPLERHRNGSGPLRILSTSREATASNLSGRSIAISAARKIMSPAPEGGPTYGNVPKQSCERRYATGAKLLNTPLRP